MTLLELCDQISPKTCRLYAHKRGKAGRHYPPSNTELVKRSGLSKGTVWQLSHARSWTGCTIETIQAFSEACGVNLADPRSKKKVSLYFRKAKLEHLFTGTKSQKTFLNGLMKNV